MDRRESVGALRRATWITTALAIVGVAVAVPLMVAAHYKALGIPRSDDWSYLLVQFRFVRHGTISLNNWVSMTLVGQIMLGAPVALLSHESITAMQCFTAGAGLLGLVAVVRLGRRLVPSVWLGAFVALMVAVGPLWGPLAASFMTDIPAFTLGILSLLVGVEAFRRDRVSMPLVGASLVFGFAGYAVRQYGIVPPIAVAATAAWVLAGRRDTTRLRILASMAGLFVIAVCALFVWWRNLPQSLSLSPAAPTFHSLRNLALKGTNLFRLLGLLTAPAVLLAGPARIVRSAWHAARRLTVASSSAIALLMAGMYLHVPARPFVGNYVSRDGVLSTDVLDGPRPNVLPSALFDLLVLVGSVAAVLLVLAAIPSGVALARKLRDRSQYTTDPVVLAVALALIGYSLAYVVALATGLPLYDRYVLPLVPLAALGVLRAASAHEVLAKRPDGRALPACGRARLVTLAGGAGLVALAVVGLVFTADSASFDGTRWATAVAVTQRGYTALQIDGGFEWDSYHLGFAPSSSRPPNSGTAARAPDPKERRLHYCVKLRVGGPPARSVVVVTKPLRGALDGTSRVVAARTRACLPSG